MFSKKLERILNNKKLGSSELINNLNRLFRDKRNEYNLIEKSIPFIRKELNHFSAVESYLIELKEIVKEKDKDRLIQFLNNYSSLEKDKYEGIFNKLYNLIPEASNIITISRSGTLLNILKLWQQKNKKLKVTICESRPNFEGRLLAQDLISHGIKVELITDAMMGLFVPKVDAAVIGADSVMKNRNVVNKSGSKSLALLCRENKKPFYVVTTRSKFSNKKNFGFKKEDCDEVWSKKHKNLKIINIYFEEVEMKLTTKIITD